VPKPLWAVLGLALAVQLALPKPPGSLAPGELPPPPTVEGLQLASFGEPHALARLLGVHLQSGDFKRDYSRLMAWLRNVLELDPRSAYPLFLATRVYAESTDPSRVRIALDFAYQEFFRDPDRRWPWLAHAALIAKHRLGDLALARRYASAVQRYASGPDVPLWAKQMEIFILEDMNELAAAKIMLGGLLESGTINDPAELRFLRQRLDELEARIAGAR
jgi:hypothetical protein